MAKYADVKALNKALESAAKDRAAFEAKTEKLRAEIETQKAQLAEEINAARLSADYERFEALSKKVADLEQKLGFYDSCNYVSPVTDADVAASWIALKKTYDDRQKKLHDKFLQTLDDAISIYKDYCQLVSDELKDHWIFFSALDHSKFSPGGLPNFDFPDPDRADIHNDFNIGERITTKNGDSGAEYHKIFDLMVRGVPFED